MASLTAKPDGPRKGLLEFLASKLRGKGEPRHDEPPKFQDFHLVVAALIAAVTFQACVNPPGGVWQENKKFNETGEGEPAREAGRAVYSADETAYYVFLAFNTLAFSTSMYLLIYLTLGYPFFFEVVVAMASMGITYGASIFAITPDDLEVARSLLSIAAAPFIVRAAILIYKCAMPKK